MKKDYQYIEVQQDSHIARITLNRPERHNALILELISELSQALDEIALHPEYQFVILAGKGRSFCAGADLNWFYSTDELDIEQGTAKYKNLADLLLKIYNLPQITIVTVWGNVFGGGIGLMAACDFVLAETNTRFMFSEVKLGLLPATILPFVATRLSVQTQRKWILSGNLFHADEAKSAGLVDQIFAEAELETALGSFLNTFGAASPDAMKSAKRMINKVASGEIAISDIRVTSQILAEALLSPHGQEGVQAFLEKRKPDWNNK